MTLRTNLLKEYQTAVSLLH